MAKIQVMGRELLVKFSITWSYLERDMGESERISRLDGELFYWGKLTLFIHK
jgi:hypothetical protein